MHLCLFEERAELFGPLTLTRPVFDLRCGISTLAEKQARLVPGARLGLWVRPALRDVVRDQHPAAAVNDVDWLGSADAVLVNGRWLPEAGTALGTAPCVGLIDGEVAYAVASRRQLESLHADNLPELLHHWKLTLPTRPAFGRLVHYPWDLVAQNAVEITRDFIALGFADRPCKSSAYLAVVGPVERLWIDPSACVEPLVVADTTQGPIVIERDAVVSAFTRIEGPCFIGARTQVFGAKIRKGTSLGPQCRIGGEVEASIVHGHSNKVHDGFLGHSYVGEWVNLGAGTQNSDLRNDYGDVSVPLSGRTIATGQTKVGCFLGDHTKTGLGTLLNTGTSVGAFCNLLPAGRYAPKYVPSFASWWNGSLSEAFTLEQTLVTARTAMQRRGIDLTEAQRDLYTQLYDETAVERRRVLRESEARALRRSA